MTEVTVTLTVSNTTNKVLSSRGWSDCVDAQWHYIFPERGKNRDRPDPITGIAGLHHDKFLHGRIAITTALYRTYIFLILFAWLWGVFSVAHSPATSPALPSLWLQYSLFRTADSWRKIRWSTCIEFRLSWKHDRGFHEWRIVVEWRSR